MYSSAPAWMIRLVAASGLALACACGGPGNGGASPPPPPPLSPALSSIAITPASSDLVQGTSSALTATGTYSDASTATITTSVTWSSAQPAVASVGPSTGVVSGVAAGTSSVTASLGGVSSPAVTVNVHARSLNDTGTTASQCYQLGSDVLWPCDAPLPMALCTTQDGSVGRDASATTNTDSDGTLGFSFGAVPGGCVQDNVTGLMWEVKTADVVPGLRDWTKTYSNFTAAYNPSNQYGAATDATGFVNAVNANTLCGFSDWRLPTVVELQSLVDYGSAPGPIVDTRWFPNTDPNTQYWTASPDVGVLSLGVPSNAWLVAFGDGGVMSGPARYPYHVRLVRGPAMASARPYVVSPGLAEVTDPATGLTWRRCAEGMVSSGVTCTGSATQFTHEAALQFNMLMAPNWRLPNIKELSSIADRGLTNPAVDASAFPGLPSIGVWSSTPYPPAPANVWIVTFGDGGVTYFTRSYKAGLLLVR